MQCSSSRREIGQGVPSQKALLVQAASVCFFACLAPIYYLNKWDFKVHTKRNPFYTSKLVRMLERFPILYEIATFVENFPLFHRVYKVLPEISGDVLQVGCGTGLLNKFMKARPDIRFVNMDTNARALRFGLRHKRYASGVHGSIEDAQSLASESFDVVIFARSFHHVRRHRSALRECARLLRPGGVVMIADPIILNSRTKAAVPCGYMANSSIDGLIWRFTYDTFIMHVESCLPPNLMLCDITCRREVHISNFNLFVPQTDVVAVLRKVS